MNTSDVWQRSPARTFTNTSYLPALQGETPEKSIEIDAPFLISELNQVNSLATLEYGEGSIENELYKGLTEQRKNIVLFLAGTQHLAGSLIDWKASGIVINEQSSDFKSKIKTSMEDIHFFSCNAFGAVDTDRLSAIIARTRIAATQLLETPERSKEVETSAERMLSVVPEVDPDLATEHCFLPPQSLIDYWKPIVEKKYADLLALIPEGKEKFDCNDTVKIMNEAISVLQNKWGLLNAGMWKVQIGKSTLLVDPDNLTVWVPEKTNKDSITLKKNVVHEIGGHLLRNLQGELTGDPLVASDMPWRAIEEESLMTLLDQIIGGKPREAGIVDYLSIGLTQNVLDQTSPPNLYELETLISDFETIRTKVPLTESLQANAHNRAFRIARNMPSILIDGKLYQAPYGENLKYALGQPAANKFMTDNVGNPEALDNVMLGKFAYSNPRQVKYTEDKHLGLRYLRNRVPRAA